MKILAICGSPHKGNSYSVLNSIKENYPAIDFKILMLNEVNLEMCKGDYGCILNGEQYCPLKDDRDMIIQEMSEKRKSDNQKKADKAFDTLISGINKGERAKPSVGLVVVFNLFKSVSEEFKEVWKADYEFYKDKTDYYYETKIPFYKKMMANRYVSKVMKD